MAAVVLLSGGLDSTVAFKAALDTGGVALALTFDYGQRAAPREIEAAGEIAARFGVEHRAIALPWLAEETRTALVDRSRAVPRPDPRDLDSARAHETAAAVWVPNRNGVFVNIAAAFAEARGADSVVVGFNREEGATFPDNTEAYARAATAALALSTLSGVRVEAPTVALDKKEIVRLGRRIGAPIERAWSCYFGNPEPCGACESCLRFARAIEAAGERAWYEEARRARRREAPARAS
jgi:7-cyano-7-deazaguanine synthase